MRRSYGNVEIVLPDVAWIFDYWSACPIFHAADLVPFPNGEGARVVTTCGRPTRDRAGGYRSALPMNPRHAVKFARPCATCWPELRAQPSLFKKAPRRRLEHRQEAIA